MNEAQIMQELGKFEKLTPADKYCLKDELEMQNIPANRIDLESKHVRDLVLQVLQGRFGVEVDTSVYCELDSLAREPKINKIDDEYFELIIGDGVVEVTARELEKLKSLLNKK